MEKAYSQLSGVCRLTVGFTGDTAAAHQWPSKLYFLPLGGPGISYVS